MGLASGDGFILSAEEAALFGAVVFGVMGTAAGGLIGLATTTDRWETVSVGPWSGRVSARPVVGVSHAGLAVRLAW